MERLGEGKNLSFLLKMARKRRSWEGHAMGMIELGYAVAVSVILLKRIFLYVCKITCKIF